MELAKIENLLEKYLAAETSLKEENVLKNYFSQENVPAHLEEYKSMFNYFTNSSLDVSTKTISLPQKKNGSVMKWLSVAAMAVLFVGIYSVSQNSLTEKEEAMMAYQETQKALNLISLNLNKGNNAIAQLQTFENTQNKIFKNK